MPFSRNLSHQPYHADSASVCDNDFTERDARQSQMAYAMKRIEVDFNTLTSEPVDLVKLGQPGTSNGDQLPPLCEGERVILWESGLEVEATIIYDATAQYWMARPDNATWRDIPLSSEEEAHLNRA